MENTGTTEIYDVLKKDHDELKPLLDQLVQAKGASDETERLLDRIKALLIPHSRAEEAVFYNSLRELDATKGLVANSYREHMEAEALLRGLKGLEKLNIDWQAGAQKLRDALFHHIAQEEGPVFNEARKVLFTEEAQQMTLAFQQVKQKIQQQGDIKNMMEMVANMMPPRFADKMRNITHPS